MSKAVFCCIYPFQQQNFYLTAFPDSKTGDFSWCECITQKPFSQTVMIGLGLTILQRNKCLLLPFGYAIGMSLLSWLPSIFAYPALAGSPPPTSEDFIPQTDEELSVDVIEASKKATIFSWKLWSQPYIEGDLTCRQYQDEKICLSSNASKRLNWKVQSSNLTPKYQQ